MVHLMAAEEIVGRIWIQPHVWTIAGQNLRAANPIDFLIRSDYRTLPNFLRLFQAAIKESGTIADVMYHTSNPVTDDLYQKVFKFKPVTELRGAAVIVRPFQVLKILTGRSTGSIGRGLDRIVQWAFDSLALAARATGYTLTETPPPANEEEQLYERLGHQETVCATRSRREREWRFHGAGPLQYHVHWIRRKDTTIGYVVVGDRDVDTLPTAFAVDVICPGRPSRLGIAAVWIQVAARAVRRGRTSLFFLFNDRNARLSRFVILPLLRIPQRFLPQRLPVFVHERKGSDRGASPPIDWSTGYFLGRDFDIF